MFEEAIEQRTHDRLQILNGTVSAEEVMTSVCHQMYKVQVFVCSQTEGAFRGTVQKLLSISSHTMSSSIHQTLRHLHQLTASARSRSFVSIPTSRQRFNRYTTTTRTMAAQQTPASQVISETAKQEGGPHPGSSSAQMQSEVGKQQNFEQAAQHRRQDGD